MADDIGTVRIDLITGNLCINIDGRNSNQISVKPITIDPGTNGSVTFEANNTCSSTEQIDLITPTLPTGLTLEFLVNNNSISFPYTIAGNSTATFTVNITVDSLMEKGAKYYIYLNFETED